MFGMGQSDDEVEGAYSGAATGALTGAAVAGPVGAGAGALIGGLIGLSMSSRSKKARQKAEREMQDARVKSIFREFGAKQQADLLVQANLSRANSNNNTSKTPTQSALAAGGTNNPTMPQGFIGANIQSNQPSTAGTF